MKSCAQLGFLPLSVTRIDPLTRRRSGAGASVSDAASALVCVGDGMCWRSALSEDAPACRNADLKIMGSFTEEPTPDTHTHTGTRCEEGSGLISV